MSDRTFFDTNVLVYLYDSSAPEKQARAGQLLEGSFAAASAFISTQVLQEFYVVLRRKFAKVISAEQALAALHDMSALPTLQVDPPLIFSAIALATENQISFWDALIVRSAIEANCTRLLTEDLQDGRRIGGLVVENPFR
ncbi:MAG TPA: PIN domain-containing protein [Thermoanaerobaculia bacterium]